MQRTMSGFSANAMSSFHGALGRAIASLSLDQLRILPKNRSQTPLSSEDFLQELNLHLAETPAWADDTDRKHVEGIVRDLERQLCQHREEQNLWKFPE